MKLLTILSILLINLSLYASNINLNSQQNTNDIKLCKVFTDKAANYEKNIRNDSYAKATLESYKKRIKQYCSK